jgi:hypothetical protein
MAFEGGGSFLGAAASIAGGIGSFISHWFGITAKELLKLITFLKDNIVKLSQALLNGVLKLGRALARAVVSMVRLAAHTIKQLAQWSYRKLLALERYLKDKFAPVLRWLKLVKDHLDDFYKKYIRPIIDTIEFIRSLNRLLQVFHINVLQKLDSTLAKIESRIEEPFLWVRSHITDLENWINRIVTLDGFFQKLTLIRSMARYLPTWSNLFWSGQIDPVKLAAGDYRREQEYAAHEVKADVNALSDYWSRGEGDRAAAIDELRVNFIIAMQTEPDRG